MTTDTETALVQIPGQMTATYRDGSIVGLNFTPAANDAGYFGPSGIVLERGGLDDDDAHDVTLGFGTFWDAMSDALAPQTWIHVDGFTTGDEDTQDGPSVLIDWDSLG